MEVKNIVDIDEIIIETLCSNGRTIETSMSFLETKEDPVVICLNIDISSSYAKEGARLIFARYPDKMVWYNIGLAGKVMDIWVSIISMRANRRYTITR